MSHLDCFGKPFSVKACSICPRMKECVRKAVNYTKEIDRAIEEALSFLKDCEVNA